MKVNWNNVADFYSEFAFCELDDTRTYLDAIDVQAGESVLDVCCGPGRISVLSAERGATVTGIDSAARMLENAAKNTEAFGVADKCTFTLMDWAHVLPGQNVKKHDVVIASRCGAMMDIEKLSALANRRVGIQIFADAPSIPALIDVLFSGCEAAEGTKGEGAPAGGITGGRPAGAPAGGPQGAPGMPGGPQGGPFGAPAGPGRPVGIYKRIFDKVYEAGYDPNVRILPERFKKTFASREDAVSWVCALEPARAAGNEERVALNVAPFLTETEEGVEFCISTAAAIIFWDVAGTAALTMH